MTILAIIRVITINDKNKTRCKNEIDNSSHNKNNKDDKNNNNEKKQWIKRLN